MNEMSTFGEKYFGLGGEQFQVLRSHSGVREVCIVCAMVACCIPIEAIRSLHLNLLLERRIALVECLQ